MKKLRLCGGLALAACRQAPVPAPAPAGRPAAAVPAPARPSNQVGADDARGAVTAFLSAVEQGDLQALSAVWGDSTGLTRDRTDRTELEKREYLLSCYLRHDRYTLLTDA